MNNGHGCGVDESGTSVLFGDGEAEYSQTSVGGAEFSKEGGIECFGSVVGDGLGFHLCCCVMAALK